MSGKAQPNEYNVMRFHDLTFARLVAQQMRAMTNVHVDAAYRELAKEDEGGNLGLCAVFVDKFDICWHHLTNRQRIRDCCTEAIALVYRNKIKTMLHGEGMRDRWPGMNDFLNAVWHHRDEVQRPAAEGDRFWFSPEDADQMRTLMS